MSTSASALIVAAARSGSGKTVVTLGLQRALQRHGLRVAGAKIGPDYIDPAFHAVATGRPSPNLDGFAMGDAMLAAIAADAARDADLVVAEASMGLHDGAAGARRSSAAAVARLLGWPVVLVLDASGTAQTLAAQAHGLASFPGSPVVAGVIANNVASPRHAAMIRAGFAIGGPPLLGIVGRDTRMTLPSRHLGLVQAVETADLDARIEAMADAITAGCDLESIRAAAAPVAIAPPVAIRPPGQRIAVARDEAFAFLYPHLLTAWRAAGAEIAFFSPLADEAPASDCDVCWLPGGYPELHAARLAANQRFLSGLRAFAATRPVHGECGGYMVLSEALVDADGQAHRMAGLLPVETSFAARRLHLGYRRAIWTRDMPFADAGTASFGHEFHHATVIREGGEPLADVVNAEDEALPPMGSRVGAVTGSFFHLIA
jgi:cobyrinic acid a,c-diamide synthase